MCSNYCTAESSTAAIEYISEKTGKVLPKTTMFGVTTGVFCSHKSVTVAIAH